MRAAIRPSLRLVISNEHPEPAEPSATRPAAVDAGRERYFRAALAEARLVDRVVDRGMRDASYLVGALDAFEAAGQRGLGEAVVQAVGLRARAGAPAPAVRPEPPAYWIEGFEVPADWQAPACVPWCDWHPVEENDPLNQICFSAPTVLDFGDRGGDRGGLGGPISEAEFQIDYVHPRPDEPGRAREVKMHIAVNGHDGINLDLDQVEPIAYALLAQAALQRGEAGAAAAFEAKAQSSTVARHRVDGAA
jgi:hypothetical protein